VKIQGEAKMQNLEHILAIVGVLVPLISMVASLLNTAIRNLLIEGREVPKRLAAAGAVVNALAINLDKASAFISAARGKPLISGTAASSKRSAR